MLFGRNGERVAKTPTRLLPPSLGGRTVGDHSLFSSFKGTLFHNDAENVSGFVGTCAHNVLRDQVTRAVLARAPIP